MLHRIHKAVHRHYHTRYHGVYAHAKQLFVFDIILLCLALFFFRRQCFFLFVETGNCRFD
jgi:hypothetical protein